MNMQITLQRTRTTISKNNKFRWRPNKTQEKIMNRSKKRIKIDFATMLTDKDIDEWGENIKIKNGGISINIHFVIFLLNKLMWNLLQKGVPIDLAEEKAIDFICAVLSYALEMDYKATREHFMTNIFSNLKRLI